MGDLPYAEPAKCSDQADLLWQQAERIRAAKGPAILIYPGESGKMEIATSGLTPDETARLVSYAARAMSNIRWT